MCGVAIHQIRLLYPVELSKNRMFVDRPITRDWSSERLVRRVDRKSWQQHVLGRNPQMASSGLTTFHTPLIHSERHWCGGKKDVSLVDAWSHPFTSGLSSDGCACADARTGSDHPTSGIHRAPNDDQSALYLLWKAWCQGSCSVGVRG